MSRPPHLFFDVMDTLVRDPFWEMSAFWDTDMKSFLQAVRPESWPAFERGELSEERYLQQMFLDGRPVDRDRFREFLSQRYQWLEGMEELLRQLQSAGVPLMSLSNYPVWFELIEDKLELSRYLSWERVSCLTGLRKPDPETFREAAQAAGREPAECVLIDDRESNVSAARASGWRAFRFVDCAGLRQSLQESGIW